MRKKHGSVPKLHICSGLDSHNERKHWHSKCHYKRNSGSTSAGTNNPTRLGGLRSNRRPTDGSPSPAPAAATTTPAPGGRTAAAMASGRTLLQQRQRPPPRVAELQQRWPQGGRCYNLALAHADARGARTSTKNRRPEARMVAVIPLATGTSRAASASAPTTGAVSPPADPLRVTELQQRWPQGGRYCNLALAHADA